MDYKVTECNWNECVPMIHTGYEFSPRDSGANPHISKTNQRSREPTNQNEAREATKTKPSYGTNTNIWD